MDAPQDVDLVISAFFIMLTAASILQILHKAGYSRWWALTMAVPVVNLACLWMFAFSEWPRHRQRKDAEPSNRTIGDADLVAALFGENQEITWLKDTRWEYSRMTLTRDGRIDWKDEDKYDHDTTYFSGTYTLTGTEASFTVVGVGEARAYYDAYKDTESRHHDKDVVRRFESSRFTGEDFTVTCK